ncbi:hypothetical protein HHL19_12065 [Streptomyces sp. R302]|uniref:hypothetical protein n=1 Tax=unclassified Streptomyces TaxID=2593676 RepID=UPI00145F9BF8|nr:MULTISPECIES: hypothetical protein [unclassified Streptomyces]NML50395.1 hypothetical protein [Streptomyces sp. R301]NML79386.1 hypothetical protein [Streptomyces sp. R302]
MFAQNIAGKIGTVAAAGALALGVGLMAAPAASASTGNGSCSSTDLCVYDATHFNTSKGYYDLGTPNDKNFHGKYWYQGDHGYIGDDISSARGGGGTSCRGYSLFPHVDFKGIPLNIPKGTQLGTLVYRYGPQVQQVVNYDNIASSYSKYGC